MGLRKVSVDVHVEVNTGPSVSEPYLKWIKVTESCKCHVSSLDAREGLLTKMVPTITQSKYKLK
jgi:hypothetical protein